MSSSSTTALPSAIDLSVVSFANMSSASYLSTVSTGGLPAAGDLSYSSTMCLPALSSPDLCSLQVVSGLYDSGSCFHDDYFLGTDNDIVNGIIAPSLRLCLYAGSVGHLQ